MKHQAIHTLFCYLATLVINTEIIIIDIKTLPIYQVPRNDMLGTIARPLLLPTGTPFKTFLGKFKVDKGHPFTHTSIGNPKGSYYIPVEDVEPFFDAYRKAFRSKEILHLTEKHREIGPVLIDLDFRFEITPSDKDEARRRYSKMLLVVMLPMDSPTLNDTSPPQAHNRAHQTILNRLHGHPLPIRGPRRRAYLRDGEAVR